MEPFQRWQYDLQKALATRLRWATVLANGIFSFQKGRFWYVVRPWN
jgi:hypothetical protein